MVFGKIGDTYQANCHTYKTHATHQGGAEQPIDRDIPLHETTDTDLEQAQEFHQINANDFEESEPNEHTLITRELDDLSQCVLAGKDNLWRHYII